MPSPGQNSPASSQAQDLLALSALRCCGARPCSGFAILFRKANSRGPLSARTCSEPAALWSWLWVPWFSLESIAANLKQKHLEKEIYERLRGCVGLAAPPGVIGGLSPSSSWARRTLPCFSCREKENAQAHTYIHPFALAQLKPCARRPRWRLIYVWK